MARHTEGNETWKALLDWLRGSTPAERLAGLVLLNDGYQAVDPSHPLGGPDGIKDIICTKQNKKWVAGVYFSRGQKSFSEIKNKFLEDALGKEKNDVDGFVFFTNQELKLSEREKLISEINFECEIYHLERISLMLNYPSMYGVRLEFLDIEMTKEEQLAFIASRDKVIEEIQLGLSRIEKQSDKNKQPKIVYPKFEPIIGHLFSGKELKSCSHCGYSFYISTNYRILGLSALYGGEATITCPSCGHVEKI